MTTLEPSRGADITPERIRALMAQAHAERSRAIGAFFAGLLSWRWTARQEHHVGQPALTSAGCT